MCKVTDNQIILHFGCTIKQPAEAHGEHQWGKWASGGQVTHPPPPPKRLAWQLLASWAAITAR